MKRQQAIDIANLLGIMLGCLKSRWSFKFKGCAMSQLFGKKSPSFNRYRRKKIGQRAMKW